jgi:DNA-binding NarL/FixJ family response regulator
MERSDPSSGRSRTFRILVVDDVADLRALIKAALEASPHLRVEAEAENGVQAVELAARHKPDLVLLDLAMPVQDGLMSLPQILAASPESKVIVLSAFDRARFEPLALHLGAVGYLEKGGRPDEIVSVAEAALGLP